MPDTPIQLAQRELGAPVTGQWDATTRGAISPYQSAARGPLPMSVTGHPDPATMIDLGYYDPVSYLAPSQREYLEGGAKPTSLWRDLATASNQVPQLVWIGLGVLFLGLGYYVFRKREKQAAAKRS